MDEVHNPLQATIARECGIGYDELSERGSIPKTLTLLGDPGLCTDNPASEALDCLGPILVGAAGLGATGVTLRFDSSDNEGLLAIMSGLGHLIEAGLKVQVNTEGDSKSRVSIAWI